MLRKGEIMPSEKTNKPTILRKWHKKNKAHTAITEVQNSFTTGRNEVSIW